MELQLLITYLFAASAVAGPIGIRDNAVNAPTLPTIPEEKRQIETDGAAKWPSLPTIPEK